MIQKMRLDIVGFAQSIFLTEWVLKIVFIDIVVGLVYLKG